jgi:polyphosphate kinase
MKPAAMDLDDPRLYLNRELSWLEFNHRVLEEACDPANPLLEQLKFLAIVSSNLDEFFMVRVAGVMSQVHATGSPAHRQLLDQIRARIQAMVAQQYQILRDDTLPRLAREGVRLLSDDQLSDEQRRFVEAFFHREVFPVLAPLAVDPGHPLPHLHNLSMNFIVALTDPRDPLGARRLALVEAPHVLPRLIKLPTAGGGQDFIRLGQVIAARLPQLFLGYRVRGASLFRVTRDADLNIDEDDAEDLLKDIEQALRERDRGAPVRLEVESACDPEALSFLQRVLELSDDDTYVIDGPLNLKDFFAWGGLPGCEHLRDRPFVGRIAPGAEEEDLFAAIRRGPILMHHPYHTFQTVVEFVNQAAEDPDVLAIKQTLYRTSGDSPIVRALARAAENGKQVAVLVELKARFDEGPNIRWARELEEAGVHVVYGLVGLKTHCKVICVVRRERDGIRRYCHLGTGNYHPTTAKLYTDLGLLTCDPQLGEDCTQLFNILTGYSRYPRWHKLAVAPDDLKPKLLSLIAREARHAREGRGGRVIAKCNAVIEPQVIRGLYEASQAGVEIDLISRGICGLLPGVPGVSATIRVRSIVGRFLEHSRIYCFANAGSPEVYLSSADLMDRNLNRRVETMFPVDDPTLRDHIINDVLRLSLADNAKARLLGPDGTWTRPPLAAGAPRLNSQEEFLRQTAEQAAEPVADGKFASGARFLVRWLADERGRRG